eukprot:g70127.t1
MEIIPKILGIAVGLTGGKKWSDMVLGTYCDAFWDVFVTTSQVFCMVRWQVKEYWLNARVVAGYELLLFLSERGIYERVLGFDV